MNILLVSDNENVLEQLNSKLVFLRKDDFICKSDYRNAQSNITLKKPDVILLCENELNDETVDLIKIIKRKTSCPLVLVTISNNRDFILCQLIFLIMNLLLELYIT
ncbi:hypothetical protein J6P92_03095 [bacterium]|nr:hypothetical protein [bacterium]